LFYYTVLLFHWFFLVILNGKNTKLFGLFCFGPTVPPPPPLLQNITDMYLSTYF
jgi:hypothetical protein